MIEAVNYISEQFFDFSKALFCCVCTDVANSIGDAVEILSHYPLVMFNYQILFLWRCSIKTISVSLEQ